VFIGLGGGSGYGWHPRSRLDFRRDIEASASTGSAGPLITPEVGYQLTTKIALSVQARYQFIRPEGSGDVRSGSPAKNAWAVFGHATYNVIEKQRLQMFASAALGVGSGFRVTVAAAQGQVDLTRDDSVRGGPVILGPGAGAEYHFTRHVSGIAELKLLAGIWDPGVVADLGFGVRLAF